LKIITDLTPLHLVIERAANEAALRVTREGSGNERIRNRREWSSLTKHIPYLDLPSDETGRRYNFERNFTTKLSDKKSWEKKPTTHAFKENTIKWYTDGSKTNKGTEAGVYGPGTKCSEALGTYPSVFQAKIHAIERCIDFNLLKNYRGSDIAILSDSQKAIKALSSYAISSKIVWECLGKLNELDKDNRVSMVWIPGHTGIEGNEKANKLAKAGTSTPFVGPEPFCGLGQHTLKQHYNAKEESDRALLWLELPGLRHSKRLLGHRHHNRSNSYLHLTLSKIDYVFSQASLRDTAGLGSS